MQTLIQLIKVGKEYLKNAPLIVAYQDDYRTQEGLADAICGIGGANGKLPVTPPESGYKYGDGLGLDEIVRLGWNWKEKTMIGQLLR